MKTSQITLQAVLRLAYGLSTLPAMAEHRPQDAQIQDVMS